MSTAALDPEECLRLAGEFRETDRQLPPGPWISLFGRLFRDGDDAEDRPPEVLVAAIDDALAEAFADVRNNLVSLADQLEAAAKLHVAYTQVADQCAEALGKWNVAQLELGKRLVDQHVYPEGVLHVAGAGQAALVPEDQATAERPGTVLSADDARELAERRAVDALRKEQLEELARRRMDDLSEEEREALDVAASIVKRHMDQAPSRMTADLSMEALRVIERLSQRGR